MRPEDSKVTPQPVQTRGSAGDSDGPPLPERKELIFEVIFVLYGARKLLEILNNCSAVPTKSLI